jgi:hypothetical protein
VWCSSPEQFLPTQGCQLQGLKWVPSFHTKDFEPLKAISLSACDEHYEIYHSMERGASPYVVKLSSEHVIFFPHLHFDLNYL